MAEFVRQAGDSLTPTQHSNKLFFEHLKLLTLKKELMGTQGSGRPIIMDNTLRGKAGERVRHTYIPFVHADPIVGQDKSVAGNENSFFEFGLDLEIDEFNFAFKKRGKMTDQRTLYNTRQILSKQVSQNFEQFNEDQIFKVASGIGYKDFDRSEYLSATNATARVNGNNRCYIAQGSTSSAVAAQSASDNASLIGTLAVTDLLSPELIEDTAVGVRTGDSLSNDNTGSAPATNDYKLTPLRVGPDNEEVFLLYVSLKAARDLKRNQAWLDHAYSLSERGFETSPIARGALGVWDNVIVKSSERVLEFGAGSEKYARNLLMGADAVFSGWAQTLDYTEEMEDYNRRLGVNGCEIRGETKVAFNGVDLGVAQVISASN
jgi:hypothetical protein